MVSHPGTRMAEAQAGASASGFSQPSPPPLCQTPRYRYLTGYRCWDTLSQVASQSHRHVRSQHLDAGQLEMRILSRHPELQDALTVVERAMCGTVSDSPFNRG